METSNIIIGILGLQITIIAGLMGIADAIGTAGTFWFIMAVIGMVVTALGYIIL